MSRRVRRTLILVAALAAVAMAVVPATAALASATCTVPVNYHNHALPGLKGGSVDCGMVRTAHSDAVGTLQRTLNQCYRAPLHQTLLVVDNDFGPLTEAALKDAQARSGADPDGKYGPQTRAALKWRSNVNVNDPCSRV